MLEPIRKGFFAKRKVLWIWIAIVAFAVLGILTLLFGAIIAGYAAYNIVEHPKFCGNWCHSIMKEAYDSWKASSHKHIPCSHCHTEPGLKGFYKGTIEAAINEMWMTYATEEYDMPYSTEKLQPITGKSCTAHCHEQDRLMETTLISSNGIAFDHGVHPINLEPKDKELPCLTCHSTDKNVHMITKYENCYLCHLKENAKEKLDCESCHIYVPLVTYLGMIFDHRKDIPANTSCRDCHSNAVLEGGAATSENCLKCHQDFSAEDAEGMLEDSDSLHSVHIADKKARCEGCHNPPIHIKDVEISVACEKCHTHPAEIYMGLNIYGEKEKPSGMFTSDMACTDCHLPEEDYKVQAETCVNCHEGDNNKLLEPCQKLFKIKVDLYNKQKERLENAIAQAKDKGIDISRAEMLLNRAKFIFKKVEDDPSMGVHNFNYLSELIEQALKLIEEGQRSL